MATKEFTTPMVQDFGRSLDFAVVTAATTDKTGATTTNLVKLCEGSSAGSKLSSIVFKCQGTSVDATGLIFVRKSEGDYLLFDEIPLAAITSSNTAPSERNAAVYGDLPFDDNVEIYVGVTALSASVNWTVFAIIGDYEETA